MQDEKGMCMCAVRRGSVLVATKGAELQRDVERADSLLSDEVSDAHFTFVGSEALSEWYIDMRGELVGADFDTFLVSAYSAKNRFSSFLTFVS